MTVSFLVGYLLPTVVPIAAGYAVARWVGFQPDGFQRILRYVFLPALLFILLIGPIKQPVLFKVAFIGAATALAGFFLLPPVAKALKANIDTSAALPNVASFLLPFLLLSWQHKPLGVRTAAVYFVAVAVAYVFAESRSQGFKRLIREPWLWAALAALAVQLLDVNLKTVMTAVRPVGQAAYPVLLVFLGASMHPVAGSTFSDKDAWLSVGFRLAVGAGVGLLAVAILEMPRVVDETIIVAAFAPPATAALSLVGPGERGSGRVAALGTLVSIVAMVVLVVVDW